MHRCVNGYLVVAVGSLLFWESARIGSTNQPLKQPVNHWQIYIYIYMNQPWIKPWINYCTIELHSPLLVRLPVMNLPVFEKKIPGDDRGGRLWRATGGRGISLKLGWWKPIQGELQAIQKTFLKPNSKKTNIILSIKRLVVTLLREVEHFKKACWKWRVYYDSTIMFEVLFWGIIDFRDIPNIEFHRNFHISKSSVRR